jgi:hypothetical protein
MELETLLRGVQRLTAGGPAEPDLLQGAGLVRTTPCAHI